MDEQERISRADIELTLGFLASPLGDYRLPPPDVWGHLADRQIYRTDFDTIVEHVRESWPHVVSIRAGVYDKPYFSIHIYPFSQEAQRDHWPLAEWMRMALCTDDCLFYFLPPMDEEPNSAEVMIYQAASDTDSSDKRQAA